MKGKVVIILIMMLLITSSFGIISIAKTEEIETNSESSIEIYVGDFDIYGEMGGFFYITISPYYNFNIDVGDEGAMITLYANYVMDCQHWMDDGYVEMSLVGTSETASATTGEFATGRLEISHFFTPGESFVVKLYAKYTWWYGIILKGQRTDYSFGSTAPAGPQYPEIELTPASYDFGDIDVGDCSSEIPFILQNVGSETAEGDVYLTGDQSSQFTITSGSGSFSLETGQTKIITVKFCPTSTGSKIATLTAEGLNCNSDSSSLIGMGVESPKIELTPSSYDFGVVGIGESSEPQTFILENVGGETAEGVVYIDGNSDFVITMGGGEFSLGSGQTKTIEVIFSPTSENSMSAPLIAFGYNCYSDSSYLTGVGEKGDSVSIQKISNGHNLLKILSNFWSFIR